MPAAESAALPVPEGFVAVPMMSGFGRVVGPWYEKRADDRIVRAFRVEERHTNRLGIAHGGMLMAFADVLMGEAGSRASGKPSVTMRMTVDFVGPAKLGDWVEGEGEVSRTTRNLVFVRARIWRGRHTLLTTSGVFNFIRPREETAAGAKEKAAR